MPKRLIAVTFALVVLAFAGTVSAQDLGHCLEACARQLQACDPSGQSAKCDTLPECNGVALGDSAEGLKTFCTAYCASGMDDACASTFPGWPQSIPQPPAPPPSQPKSEPKSEPKATPAPPLTEEQKCLRRGGVWAEIPDRSVPPGEPPRTKFVCKSLAGVWAEIMDLRRRADQDDIDDADTKRRLEALEQAPGMPEAFKTEIRNELKAVNIRLDTHEDRLNLLDKGNEIQSARLDENDRRLNDLETWRDPRTSFFGFELRASLGLQVVKPHEDDALMMFAGGELAARFAFARHWTFLVEAGAGYGGQDYEDEPLVAIMGSVNWEAELLQGFFFGFGPLFIQRFDPNNIQEYGFYSPAALRVSWAIPENEANSFIIGLRAAIGASVFPSVNEDRVIATADGLFSLMFGFAHL